MTKGMLKRIIGIRSQPPSKAQKKVHALQNNHKEEATITNPYDKTHVVLYYTSSHVIRETHILFQKRDLFISHSFCNELSKIFGKKVSVPQLFIRGKYVGGFNKIMELNESGKLREMVKEWEIEEAEEMSCKMCGDMRYIVCFDCKGSKRSCAGEGEAEETCITCNENGLLPCAVCLMGAVLPTHDPSNICNAWASSCI